MKHYLSILILLFSTSLFAQNGTWRLYNTNNSDIAGNNVLAIAADSKGAIWVGTLNGLCRLTGKNTWTDYAMFNKKLKGQSVNCMTFDKDGWLWIGTDDFGVIAFDGTHWKEHELETRRLNMKFIGDISIDNEGIKWIGVTLVGLVRVEDKKWEMMTPNDSGLPSDFVLCTAIDQRNRRWISYTPENSGIADMIIPAVVIDDEDVKWVGTLNGLCRYDGETWSTFTKDNSPLPSNQINALTIDSHGWLWIATNEGVAVFDRKGSWDSFTPEKNKLPRGSITSIVSTPNGDIFVGYDLYGMARLSGYVQPIQVASNNKNTSSDKTTSGECGHAAEKISVIPHLDHGYVEISFEGIEADVEFFTPEGESVRHIPHYKKGAHINITKMPRRMYTLRIKTARTDKEIKFNLK